MIIDEDRRRYYEEYYKNEHDANRQMAFVNLFAGILVTIAWLLYLFHLIPLHANIYLLVAIVLPINALILLSPLFYLKTKKIKKKNFKYFVVFSLLMVVAIFNILVPKHGIIAWTIALVLTSHYYNPKLGRMVFFVTLGLMLICLYLGMFLGEYDPHLLTDGVMNGEVVYNMKDGVYFIPNSPQERYELLHKLLEMGENRYLKVFLFYYLSRAALLTLVFLICNALNNRTYKLLVNEIKVSTDQSKISTELEVAKDIQLATLPNGLFATEDVEIVAELKAAKEVGGDFYDYFNIDDEHIAIVIGDVSGKGIPAAMFMMKTITCFKNFVRVNKTPGQILKEVNEAILERNDSQMFVTCFLAILNTKTGQLMFSNAGHNPPIVGDNRHFRYLKCSSGFILGGLGGLTFKDEEIKLNPEETITLYTDGITEARNNQGGFFGEEKLLSVFNKKDYTCLVELHHTIKDEISAFVEDAPQSDDITYITLKYHGNKYSYEEKIFDKVMIDNLPPMLNFIKSFSEKRKFPKDFTSNLLVVGDELLSNIVKYGYENKGGEIFIRLLFNEDKKEFVLTVIDKAPEFNQLEVNKDIVSNDVENQHIGGLGILIVKKIMSECAYDRINGKNILVLRKKF